MGDIMRSDMIAATFAGALLLCSANATSAREATGMPQLDTVAESHSMIWNAVAVHENRIFVAGPRWTGSKGPAVALLNSAGPPRPYPDAAWNGWTEGADPKTAFVNVNAIHLDGKGGLWVIDTGADLRRQSAAGRRQSGADRSRD